MGFNFNRSFGQTAALKKAKSEASAAKKQLAQFNDAGKAIDRVTSDFKQGRELGQEILGPEGLGRIKEQQGVQDVGAKLKEQAEGFSGAETTARRETALQKVQQGGQAQSRALQASLARSGVKGGAAGAQVAALAGQGAQQRGQIERDLFIEGENAARSGTQNLANFELDTNKFDIGQAAKEKNIIAQSGLSAAQLASGERSAIRQSSSADKAAAASAAAACFIEGSLVTMMDGSTKKIEDIVKGDLVDLGGAVDSAKTHFTTEKIYLYKGEFCTGSHEVYEAGGFINVEDSALAQLHDENTEGRLVYSLDTKHGVYNVGGFISTNLNPVMVTDNADMFDMLDIANFCLERGVSLPLYFYDILRELTKGTVEAQTTRGAIIAKSRNNIQVPTVKAGVKCRL